jgi:hypothetical protein
MHWAGQTKYSGGCYRLKPGAVEDRPQKVSEHYHQMAWRCAGRRIDIAGPKTGFGSRDTHITCAMQADGRSKSTFRSKLNGLDGELCSMQCIESEVGEEVTVVGAFSVSIATLLAEVCTVAKRKVRRWQSGARDEK